MFSASEAEQKEMGDALTALIQARVELLEAEGRATAAAATIRCGAPLPKESL